MEAFDVISVSDEQLVSRTLRGDSHAFSALVDRHRGRVLNLAYRMLGNRERAEDAAQEAFVRAYSRLDSYRPGGRFISWLLSITAHLCIDELRRRPFAADSLEDIETETHTVAAAEDDPAGDYEREEHRRATHAALGRLSDEQRLAMVLVHLQDMTYEQAAEVMGIPAGTVKSHAHRGRARLKQMLAPHVEELRI